VFGAAGKHAVRFFGSQRGKVVYQYADVRFGAAQYQRRPALQFHRRVDPGHQALGSCFLVTGTAVGLPCREKAAQALGFQIGVEVKRIEVVVLHRIGRAHNTRLFKPGNAVNKIALYVFGQGA